MSDKKGLHDGHRDRVRKRFEKDGMESFYDHQVLEMLLFYGIPRKDTNDIAHQLLNCFGSFSGVFDASIDALQDCGISYNAAVLLKMIPEICAKYYQDKYEKNNQTNRLESIDEFLLPYFIGKNEEQVMLLLLDTSGKQVFFGVVSKGTKMASDVNLRKILELSVQHKANGAILAHNHPSGEALPSERDLMMTEKLCRMLRPVGVRLVDHYIIAGMKAFSMSESEDYDYVFLAR